MPPLIDKTRSRAGQNGSTKHTLARSLGWFSIGLGAAQIAASKSVSKLIGIKDNPALMRALGLREIASGVAILRGSHAEGLRSRVVGDVMDLSLLAAAFGSRRSNKTRLAAATAAVAGVTALDVACTAQHSQAPAASDSLHVKKAITIMRSPEELYQWWRDFTNLPKVISYLESVQVLDEKHSHWVARGPGDMRVEWDGELVEDKPNQRIGWRSLPGSDMQHFGCVHFVPAPGGRGTEVHVSMRYKPPAGSIGAAIGKLLGKEPAAQLEHGLRALRQVMEAGEVVTTEGQSSGASMIRKRGLGLGDLAARAVH